MTNPYQTRFELLMAAEARLVNEYHAKMEQWRTMEESKVLIAPALPQYPTKEQIFELANELKAFIETK